MHNLSSRAAIALIEHGLIYYYSCFNVFGGVPHISPVTTSSIAVLFVDEPVRAAISVRSPLQIAGVGASLIGFSTGLENDMRMLLRKMGDFYEVLVFIDFFAGREYMLWYHYFSNDWLKSQ